jgi:hypothetical protein
MVLGGYSLGHFIPNIGQYIHYVIGVVIVLSLLPPAISLWRAKKRSAQAAPANSAIVPGDN